MALSCAWPKSVKNEAKSLEAFMNQPALQKEAIMVRHSVMPAVEYQIFPESQ